MNIGVIGGKEVLKGYKESIRLLKNPYSDTEVKIREIKLGKHNIYIMNRHGESDHTIPSELVNYKANIWAFHQLNCAILIGVTASGTLVDKYNVGSIIVPDQIIDFTKQRCSTFNKVGTFKHVSMKNPFSSYCFELFKKFNIEKNLDIHFGGTMITIEGPQFSSFAESFFYRSIGAEIINMTTATEAKLCKEIGLKYQPFVLISDIDISENEDISFDLIKNNISSKAPTKVNNYLEQFFHYI